MIGEGGKQDKYPQQDVTPRSSWPSLSARITSTYTQCVLVNVETEPHPVTWFEYCQQWTTGASRWQGRGLPFSTSVWSKNRLPSQCQGSGVHMVTSTTSWWWGSPTECSRAGSNRPGSNRSLDSKPLASCVTTNNPSWSVSLVPHLKTRLQVPASPKLIMGIK